MLFTLQTQIDSTVIILFFFFFFLIDTCFVLFYRVRVKAKKTNEKSNRITDGKLIVFKA